MASTSAHLKQSLLIIFCFLTFAYSAASTQPSITWSKCPGVNAKGLDCGTIEVPLNHAKPQGKKIRVAMARLKAQGKSKGSVVFNPGGPGESALEVVIAQASGVKVFGDELLQNYDIIGPDPRGVGHSTPVKCDPDKFNERVTTVATSQAWFEKLAQHNGAVGKSCARMTGPLINHIDSRSVAQDFEMIRSALGEKKLNYLGQSYGTLIGSMYLEMFPEKAGRFVLDGNVDHSLSPSTATMISGNTYEATLQKFFDWCDGDTKCALHGKNPAKVFDTLRKRARRNPIPAAACKQSGPTPCLPNVSEEDLLYDTFPMLFSVNKTFISDGWAALGKALNQAHSNNDASAFSKPLAASSKSNALFAVPAVTCLEWPTDLSHASDMRLRTNMMQVFGRHTRGLGIAFRIQEQCVGWPAPVTNPPHKLNQTQTSKAPPVLLVNAQFDPSTSLVWANGLREQLPSAALVTRRGAGHTSYALQGEATRVMDRFLVRGELLEDDSVVHS